MAIDYVRNIISSGYNLSKINDNFVKIQKSLQDGLSRSGNGPNQMSADLDMNSNDILNVANIAAKSLTVSGMNTADILNKAAKARDSAAAWASAPSSDTINDGVNPVGKSSYHWAQVALGAATGALPDGSVTEAKLADAVSLARGTVVADRTALKGLKPARHRAAYLTETGREGQWLWDETVPIATHQADVFEQRYIAPDKARSGAWVRAGSVQTGGRFTNDSPAPRIHRFADRVFVGDASVNNGARDGDARASWLGDSSGGTHTRIYMESSAQFASVSSAGIAITGAARGGPGKGASIGVIGFGMSYGNGGDYDNAFGFYGEGIRGNPNASAWAMELESVNLHPSPSGENPFTPFGAINSSKPNGLGITLGLTLMAGGDPLVNPKTYNSDVALEIGNNGARWLTGINIDDNALFRHPDGRAYAVNLGRGHMLTWYDDVTSTRSPAFRLLSEISHSVYYREIYANDLGVGVRNKNGDVLFRVGTTLGDTGIEILPDAVPVVQPIGSAANINLTIRGKGAGGVTVGGSAGTLGFLGSTPVVKQEVAGSKNGNAALTSLIQKLAIIGLITDRTT